MKIQWLIPVLLLTGLAADCQSMRDDFQGYLISRQNKTLAQKAWERLGPQTCDFLHEDHYQNGFIAGHMDTALGKSGCSPALPPRKYWESTYLSSQGREQIDAWFQGYSLGASLAKLDGNAGRN
ncbi:MAG: hypothetical protein IH899_02990 [Planctomycetes bacterium]|nr:hypothetical protein [Planctomycetota bacterium]